MRALESAGWGQQTTHMASEAAKATRVEPADDNDNMMIACAMCHMHEAAIDNNNDVAAMHDNNIMHASLYYMCMSHGTLLLHLSA